MSVDELKILNTVPPYAGNLRPRFWLQPDYLDLLLLGLEIVRVAHDRPRRPHRAHEMGNLALGLLPQFRACMRDMRPRIGSVGKLAHDYTLPP